MERLQIVLNAYDSDQHVSVKQYVEVHTIDLVAIIEAQPSESVARPARVIFLSPRLCRPKE